MVLDPALLDEVARILNPLDPGRARELAGQVLAPLVGRSLTRPASVHDAEQLPGASPNLQLVWTVVCDGEPHTIGEIADRCRLPETSVSARLRELREPKFGLTVDKARDRATGAYSYRVVVP